MIITTFNQSTPPFQSNLFTNGMAHILLKDRFDLTEIPIDECIIRNTNVISFLVERTVLHFCGSCTKNNPEVSPVCVLIFLLF